MFTAGTHLKNKLVEQEAEVVNAMEEIAKEVAEERKKLTATSHSESSNQREIQKLTKEYENKYNQLKEEKENVLEEMVILQKE